MKNNFETFFIIFVIFLAALLLITLLVCLTPFAIIWTLYYVASGEMNKQVLEILLVVDALNAQKLPAIGLNIRGVLNGQKPHKINREEAQRFFRPAIRTHKNFNIGMMYSLLSQMEKQGLVRSQTEELPLWERERNGRDHLSYHIVKGGRNHLIQLEERQRPLDTATLDGILTT